ncbi:hypothetical protein LIA77_02893 [Sarocladium implicatum]|nr:hypothetical protein LIA77_02893 [Sarocladium implicatum]
MHVGSGVRGHGIGCLAILVRHARSSKARGYGSRQGPGAHDSMASTAVCPAPTRKSFIRRSDSPSQAYRTCNM